MVVAICFLLLINAIVLPASAFQAAIGIDVVAIVIAFVWMLGGPLMYALGNRVGGNGRRVFRYALAVGGAALVAAVGCAVGGAVAGAPVLAKVAPLAGMLTALCLVVAFFASLMVRRPAVSKRASLSAIGMIGGIAGVIALLWLGNRGIDTEFIPNSDTGSIRMTLSFPTGTPLKTTQLAVDRLEEAIVKVDGIEKVITTTGVKPSGFGSTIGGNVARMYAEMNKNRRKETNRAVRDIRKLSSIAPGALFTVAGEGGGGGGGDPINYTLSGPEDVIDAAANKLAAYVRSLPGTVNVQTGAELAATRLDVLIDRAKCAVYGVNPGTAGTAARIAIGGAVATRVRTVTGLVDVRVQLPAQYRNRIEQVRNIAVRANDGSMYHLGDVATFSYVKAPTKIERLDKQRVAHVSGGIDPGITTLGPVVNKLNAATSTPGFFPNGVALRASGDSQFLGETISSMSIALLTSFALVYVLMVILYGSFFTPAVIMLSVPVALVGALFMLAATHQSLNLFSMIGIIMLFGLVAKNGILLVDYANTMRKRGMRAVDAMRAAAGTRLRPIVMTTAAMVFGMLPLSLGLAEGAEFRRSMGTVLIGGLLSSLILTLFLVPVVYSWVVTWLENRADKRALLHEHEDDEFSAPPPRIPAGAMGD